MTQLVLASIGIGLAAVGVPALVVGFLGRTGARRRGYRAAWQGGVMLVAGMSLAGAVSIGYGLTAWDNGHHGAPGGAAFSGPLQDPAPGDGCTAGPLSC